MVERKVSIDQSKMDARHAEETRKRCLPLELRIRLYDEVLQLRREEGLSYNRIIERIHRLDGVRLSKTHIRYWVRGKHKPLGRVNEFDATPSSELCYVIGTVLSDGSLHLHSDHHYAVSLEIKDYEYAYEFSKCLAKLLGRKNPYSLRCRARLGQSKQHWLVEANSILLYRHLDKPWRKLKPHIEANRTCVAAFLRAFFDGEGSVCERRLTVYNADKQLLIYIKGLLKRYFDIDATGPRICTKKGTVMRCPRTGKAYKASKDCHHVYVRAHSLLGFYKAIGFTIKRKQRALAEAVKK